MCNPLRVLVLAQYFSPDMGGGSTRATIVVKGLLSKSCNVTAVVFPPLNEKSTITKVDLQAEKYIDAN